MSELQNIPWGLIIPFIVISFILLVIAIIDCIRAEETRGPKWMWVIIILCVSTFGPVLYFIFGRRQA